MICKKCGQSNADGYNFCRFCGAAIYGFPAQAQNDGTLPPRVRNGAPAAPGGLDAWLIDDASDASLEIRPPAAHELHGAPFLDAIEVELTPVAEGYAPPIAADLSRLIELDLEATAGRRHRDLDRICSTCGTMVALAHKFCGKCGTRYEPSGRASSGSFPPVKASPSGAFASVKVSSSGAFSPVQASTDNAFLDASRSKKRSIERVSFVSDVPQSGPSPARFMLCHVNDDGTMADIIPLYEGENFIGRASSPALGSDRFVSPRHVCVTCTQDQAKLEDAGSLNGVYERVSGISIALNDGDAFRLGEELLSYSHGSVSQPILKNNDPEQTSLLGGSESPGWGYLRVILGPFSEGCVYRLSKPSVVLGRTNGDILFPRDGFVSGSHASLRNNGDNIILTDLDSSNGTFIRLKQPKIIAHTTFFLIGNQLLRIKPMQT